MNKKTLQCDACGRRIRINQHDLLLRDFETGQILGHYHAHPGCQGAMASYFTPGVALRATVSHPPRCGGDLTRCDGGAAEA